MSFEFDPQNSKWTAYVLDELDAPQRAAAESELQANPAALELVAKLRETVTLLTGELQGEGTPQLLPTQREAIAAGVSEKAAMPSASVVTLPTAERKSVGHKVWVPIVAALAASLLVGMAIWQPKARETARTKAPVLIFDGDESMSMPDTNAKDVRGPAATAQNPAEVDLPRGESSPADHGIQLDYTSKNSTPGVQAMTSSDSEPRQPSITFANPSQSQATAGTLSLPTGSTTIARPVVDSSVLPIDARRPDKNGDGGWYYDRPGSEPGRYDINAFQNLPVNKFIPTATDPLSTFAIDVDTASYSIVRRFLMEQRQLPPPEAVRAEELINYFHYNYPQPDEGDAFAVQCEVAQCPWNHAHRLARVGIKGREIPRGKRPVSNLVFLIDVSGSMMPEDRLPLVKRGLAMLVDELTENDHVAIVYYADGTGLALPSTSGDQKDKIKDVIRKLAAGGSTNGAGGIELAYKVAVQNFIKGGINRVILATDGDFNVGITDRNQLIDLIKEKALSGVSLTTLGVGMGNLKDATLEQLADKGHGNYAYLDNVQEAHRVLVEQINGTLVTIAKDVKIQIEFNPAQVRSHRLIGYENRLMKHEDFNNHKKDGGDIGSGHTVTALYELIPVDAPADESPAIDGLKYQPKPQPVAAKNTGDGATASELFTLKLRHKQPAGDKSKLQEIAVKDSGKKYGQASADFKFAAAVASFSMLLRHSPYVGDATYGSVAELAQEGIGRENELARHEFVDLVKQAGQLDGGSKR